MVATSYAPAPKSMPGVSMSLRSRVAALWAIPYSLERYPTAEPRSLAGSHRTVVIQSDDSQEASNHVLLGPSLAISFPPVEMAPRAGNGPSAGRAEWERRSGIVPGLSWSTYRASDARPG